MFCSPVCYILSLSFREASVDLHVLLKTDSIVNNSSNSDVITMSSHNNPTAHSIPVFIQQGCDVLTTTIAISSSIPSTNQYDEILRNFGGNGHVDNTSTHMDHVTPELLRRVKFGLCEEQEEQMMQSLQCQISTQSYLDPAHTLWDLASHAIEEQLWTQQIVDNMYNTTSQQCPHILPQHSVCAHADAPEAVSIEAYDLIADPTMLHALLMKYGSILNKLKKLQQLEESNAKLTNDVFAIVKNNVEFPLQSRFFSNILDGVELVMPVSLKDQKQSRKNASMHLRNNKKSLKYANAAEAFHDELKLLVSNTSNIDSFKQNEEQFWKWIGTCKLPTELQERSSVMVQPTKPTAFEIQLRQAFTPLITRLNGYLTELEDAVISAVLNNKKISPQQLASILSYHNANVAEKFKDHVTIVPTLTTPLFGQSTDILAQLLQLPPKSAEVTFATELQELRGKHRSLMKKLIDDFSPHSPFRPIIKG